MPWDAINGWVSVLPEPCTGCEQRVLPVDSKGRCSDCALYDQWELWPNARPE